MSGFGRDSAVGARIKGKLVVSLANGLPAVASTIAVEGIPTTHGTHVFVGDLRKVMPPNSGAAWQQTVVVSNARDRL
jgi:hypothetical protein